MIRSFLFVAAILASSCICAEDVQKQEQYFRWREEHCKLVRTDVRAAGDNGFFRIYCYTCDDGVERCDQK